jgi:hypothetical protein
MRAAGKTLIAAAEFFAFSDAECRFRATVRSREPMGDEMFWATSYKKSGIPFEIATTVRRVYGEQLGHDVAKLRADDLDPAMAEIGHEMVMEIEEAFGISISDREAERTSGSIDSLVRLVAGKLGHVPSMKLSADIAPAGLAPARRTASSA